jgi:hypothetical protein
VAVKSQKPRLKAYLDEQGQRQTIKVYRYYCKNPDCPFQTFTNFPPGVMAHSVWTLDARVKALELYAGLRTNYRGAANALGVAPSTLYHWLEQFGAEPLQVAALFGLVRSSGVVGIDEKYVKVPKNNKPAGKQRKWTRSASTSRWMCIPWTCCTSTSSRTWAKTRRAPSCSNCALKAITRASSSPT